MKKILNKIANVLSIIYGYGIMLALFLGGLTFFGYLAALIIGGETATAICTFIYKSLYPILVYASSIFVLLGIVVMYMRGETALSSKRKEKAKTNTESVETKSVNMEQKSNEAEN